MQGLGGGDHAKRANRYPNASSGFPSRQRPIKVIIRKSFSNIFVVSPKVIIITL